MILRNQNDPRYRIKKDRPVYVYKNLHKDCWSIKQHGLVKAHIPKDRSVGLWDCYFHVDIKGREKVLQEKRKNVHAFVRGDITVFDDFDPDYHPNYLDYTLVMYNPYKFDTFVDVYDTSPIRTAKRAFLRLQPSMVVDDPINRPYVYAEGAKS